MSRTSVFPAGLRLEGTIEGDGDLVVAGVVVGGVSVSGQLVLEESGRIEGDVQAMGVIVRGVLAGNVEAKETIRVEPSAVVVGDATAPRVSIQQGAKVRGKVRMSGEPMVPKPARRRRSRNGQNKKAADARGSEPQPPRKEARAEPLESQSKPAEDRPKPRRKKRRRARRPPPPTIPVVQRQKARRKDRPQGNPTPA